MVIGIDASRGNAAHRTGTEWYSYHLIRALVALDRVDTFRLYAKEALREGLAGLGQHVSERVLAWPPRRLWTHLRFSAEMARAKPDVLFVPAHTIPLIHPRATVTTCHDVGFEYSPQLYSPLELAYHRFSMRFAVRSARAIIAVSAFTRDELVRHYPQARDKVTVIYHGYDSNAFPGAGNEDDVRAVIARKGITAPYLLYVGRLEEKKNTPGLVAAYAIARARYGMKHQLVLVGTPGYHFDKVASLIRRNGLSPHVVLTRYVDGHELAHLYRGASLFVFPSFYEGFGMPLVEAMACGTPIAAARAASIPEIAGEGAAYFNPADPADIAAVCNRVLSDRQLSVHLRVRGRDRVQQFSWDRAAKETLTVITAAAEPLASR